MRFSRPDPKWSGLAIFGESAARVPAGAAGFTLLVVRRVPSTPLLLLCAIALGCASLRPAGFCAFLRGAGPESDALDPDARGSARLDLQGRTLRFEIRVEGTGKIVATHIHKGRTGENGPVVKELNPGFSTESSSGTAQLPEELARELASDPSAYYLKLHSLKFPGGAIRGQLEDCGSGS